MRPPATPSARTHHPQRGRGVGLALAAALSACSASDPPPSSAGAKLLGDCPPGTHAVATQTEANEPLRCVRPDGTLHGPYIRWDFDEHRRTWSITRGNYRDGRREGDFITRDDRWGAITRVEHYADDVRTRVETYQISRLEEMEPSGPRIHDFDIARPDLNALGQR